MCVIVRMNSYELLVIRLNLDSFYFFIQLSLILEEKKKLN